MPMHLIFDCCCAGPDALPPKQRRQKSKQPAAPTPELHDAARPGPARRHGRTKQIAVPALIGQHLFEIGDNVREEAAGHPDLCAINTDRAEFTGVIDSYDASDS